MNLMDIARLRLHNQQITGTHTTSAKDLVAHMGIMQAQDYGMATWALGVRLPGSTLQDIEAAIHNAGILRTHVLRPTWHFVSSDDIYWMLALTAARIKTSQNARNRQLGLTETIFATSSRIIENELSGGRHQTRESLVAALEKAGIPTGGNRASHLFFQAEMEGILCSGPIQSGKPTYALLEERVPKTRPVAKEEALALLAVKYFTSHGPATLQDFTWWSGLSAGNARHALEMVKPGFASETLASQTYWFSQSLSMPGDDETVHLLPAYDEYLISYADRSAVLPPGLNSTVVSSNGLFRPVIVIHGQVAGIWKRTIKNDRVIMEMEFFTPPGKTILDLVEKAATRYGHFLGRKIEFNPKT